MTDPHISVVVLNYKRRAELERVIQSAQAQSHGSFEIVVADNASGDGTVEWLQAAYPSVRLVALEQNLGCGGRNRGVQAARGEIVVTLDNDVRFDSPFELQKIANAFQELPDASAIVFKILYDGTGRLHLRDWCHPRSFLEYADRAFETSYIPEGACAFRRSEFLKLGGYYEPFLIGGEGWDLALRIIDASQKIVYRPEIRVRHAMAQETRAGRTPYYMLTRNRLWIAFKNYSGARRAGFILNGMAGAFFYSIKNRCVSDFLRGVRDGLRGRKQLPATIVCREGWRRFDEIQKHRPGWPTRLKTHWAHRDI